MSAGFSNFHRPAHRRQYLLFKYLLIYFGLAALPASPSSSCSAARRPIQGMNRELAKDNDFLAAISMKRSPSISRRRSTRDLSGQKDVLIAIRAEELTIFFSDIEYRDLPTPLQPAIDSAPQRVLTEMSTIALKHGGTVDKFDRECHPGVLRRPRDQGHRGGRKSLPAHGRRNATPARAAGPTVAPARDRAAVPGRIGIHRLLQRGQLRQR